MELENNITISQRYEHQKHAYESYLVKAQDKVVLIDRELAVQPIMKNSQAESLNEFIENYAKYLKSKYLLGLVDADSPLPFYILNDEIYKNDVYNQPLDKNIAKRQLLTAIERVEKINLKSNDFEMDPDNVYI